WILPQLSLDEAEREGNRDEPLLRAVVEVSLQLAACFVTRGDDPRARGLELLLLALPLSDLPNDHEELVVAAGGEPALVVAGPRGEVERVLDHRHLSPIECGSAGFHHSFGKLRGEPVPNSESLDLLDEQVPLTGRAVA